jgi:glycosyltransferase involved in cell wall biosynthesis
LPEFGYRPRLLTLSPEPRNDSMAPAFAEAGVERLTLNLSRLQGLVFSKIRVRRILSEIRPDIIHTQGIRSDLIGHALHGRIPHVLTVRNSAWDDYPAMFGRIRGSLMAWRHERLIRDAQCPVSCSHSLARVLSRVRPAISTIPNGVDTTFYRPASAEDRRALRSTLKLPDSRRVLLHVGSLIPRKRPDLLLRAFVESGSPIDAHLVFLGDGPMRPALEQMAHGRNDVLFAGAVKNVVDYLRCADLMVSTSSSEGLPNSVLEALACGVPVVLSNIEPHAEILAAGAASGVLVDPASSDALLRGMRELLGRDQHALRAAARQTAEGTFSSRKTAMSYATLYGDLSRYLKLAVAPQPPDAS